MNQPLSQNSFMSIPDSDSDDDLLNFVAFSPKIKKARMEKSSYAECTTTSPIANASTRRPGKGRADQNNIEQSGALHLKAIILLIGRRKDICVNLPISSFAYIPLQSH